MSDIVTHAACTIIRCSFVAIYQGYLIIGIADCKDNFNGQGEYFVQRLAHIPLYAEFNLSGEQN